MSYLTDTQAETVLRLSRERPQAFRGVYGRRRVEQAYQAVLRREMIQEGNGRPIPPEIAAGMTKPRETEDLYQVGVTMKDGGDVKYLGPMMGADAIGLIVEQVNRSILTGQRDDWSHAEAYPMTRIQELAE